MKRDEEREKENVKILNIQRNPPIIYSKGMKTFFCCKKSLSLEGLKRKDVITEEVESNSAMNKNLSNVSMLLYADSTV